MEKDSHPVSQTMDPSPSPTREAACGETMKPHPPAPSTNAEDDKKLYCEECRSFFVVECEVHGPALFIPDIFVPMGVPNRARQTLPPGLEVRQSDIPGAGLGVFFNGRTVPVGAHFGPYEGELVDKEEAMKSGYSWVIYKTGQFDEYVDARNETHANWMRYVNCARNEEEQNLVAIQHRGEILYRCCRLIKPGQELLVWYEDDYAEHLDITFDFLWDQKCSSKEGNVFPCSMCPLIYTSLHYLRRHVKRCHPEKYETLPQPDEVKSEGHASIQTGTSDGEKENRSCPDCGETFSQLEALQEHRCPHAGKRPHYCATCGKRFGKVRALRKHQFLHSGKKPYECPTCGKRFGKGASLRKHLRIHTGEKPYKCMDCGKSFIQKCHLQRHQRIHTGEKPYQCLQCGRSFTVQHHLQSHQRIHQRQVSHQCTQCGKSFLNQARLDMHHCIHARDRSYPCSECGQTFTQHCHLVEHQRIHTGEKPYLCSYCGKSFTKDHHLQTHHCIHSRSRTHTQTAGRPSATLLLSVRTGASTLARSTTAARSATRVLPTTGPS